MGELREICARYNSQEHLRYCERVNAGANALPFMKASYSPTHQTPTLQLPPEMVERVYMYCTEGWLSVQEVRGLYPAGVLLGMEGMTDRQIVHHSLVSGGQPNISLFPLQE